MAPLLDEAELDEYIDKHFTRTLFRLETIDEYAVASDDGDYERFLAGEPEPTMARKEAWLEVLRQQIAAGLYQHRVHVWHGPLGDYLRFECEWGYAYNVRAGEDIRILDLAETLAPAGLLNEDFWLIDDERVVLMHYDEEGHFLGGEIPPVAALPRYRAARDATWNAATPFSDYWAAHPQYWRTAILE